MDEVRPVSTHLDKNYRITICAIDDPSLSRSQGGMAATGQISIATMQHPHQSHANETQSNKEENRRPNV